MQRYRFKISGPLLDRIDLQIRVTRLAWLPQWHRGSPPEPSATVREPVISARDRQLARAGVPNAQLDGADLRRYWALDDANRAFIEAVAQHYDLSPRGCQRVLKVARTLADLEGNDIIGHDHLAEALAYRGTDSTATDSFAGPDGPAAGRRD